MQSAARIATIRDPGPAVPLTPEAEPAHGPYRRYPFFRHPFPVFFCPFRLDKRVPSGCFPLQFVQITPKKSIGEACCGPNPNFFTKLSHFPLDKARAMGIGTGLMHNKTQNISLFTSFETSLFWFFWYFYFREACGLKGAL
jgi:hypothetical protein